MRDETLKLSVEADNQADSSKAAVDLADMLRELDGVIELDRFKSHNQTMDLGSGLSIVMASGATVALARGLADWLRSKRGVTLIFEKSEGAKNLKTIVSGIDPATAERIIEMVCDK